LSVAVPYALAAVVLFATAVAMHGRQVAPSGFVPVEPLPVPEVATRMSYIQQPAEGVAHASTAVVLPGGRIAAYWFAGSREGGTDVAIRMALFDGDRWGAARDITDGARTGRDQGRHVKTVGNPVVFRHPGGEYWLVYVSVSVGGWSGSTLNLMRSGDGIAWSPSTRLVSGPFLNLSTLVKGPALLRADGLVALPAYHEFLAAYPEMLLIDAAGQVVDKVRMAGRCLIQPWVVALGSRQAVALMRPFGCGERRLWMTTTDDAGMTWSAAQPTALANPDSPAAALGLPDGRIVATLNDNPASASVLDLVVSGDGGQSWGRRVAVFDGSADGRTYRYPWLLRDHQGRLHVFATETGASGRAIRHAILGADALAGGAPE
jgi:predicted neuraminidase